MLAAKFDFDINAIFADMQKRQAAVGDRLVSPRMHAEPTAKSFRRYRFAQPPANRYHPSGVKPRNLEVVV